MILTRTYPSGRFTNVFNELFNTFPATAAENTPQNVAVNIAENENGYSLEFNAAGRAKEDFVINVEKDLLTVSFEKKETGEQKFIKKEFSANSFKRSFSLDNKINTEAIEAKYDNGILKIFLPKKEEVKNAPKQITIQ